MSGGTVRTGGRGWFVCGLLLIGAVIPAARAVYYEAGSAPWVHANYCAYPGQAAGLANGKDSDLADGAPVVDQPHVQTVTVIDPCGNARVLPQSEIDVWTPPGGGFWFSILRVDDQARGDQYRGGYYNDDGRVQVFTLDSEGAGRSCSSCSGGPAGPGLEAKLGSVDLRFHLGTTTEGESAGALWILQDAVSSDLFTRAVVKYDVQPDGVEVVMDPLDSTRVRQVRTPLLLADITSLTSTSYQVAYYDVASNLGAFDNGVYNQNNKSPFKKWELAQVTGTDDLLVKELVPDGQGGFTTRVQYLYHWVSGDDAGNDWALTTKDGGDALLRYETEEWSADQNDGQGRARKSKLYVDREWSGSAWEEVYRESTQYTRYTGSSEDWRRTQRIVDSSGAALTTNWTWTYSNTATTTGGLWLTSEQRADGSWTYYDVAFAGDINTGSVSVTQIHGWLDAAFPTTAPAPDASTVRSVTLTYAASTDYRLSSVVERVAGSVVRKADYAHTANGNGYLTATQIDRYVDVNGTTKLTETTHYEGDDDEHVQSIEFADGRMDDYLRDAATTYVDGTQPTYTVDDAGAYTYYAVTHGYEDDSECVELADYSTRDVRILNPAGLPVFEEHWAYDGTTWFVARWTRYTYDVQGRMTGTYHSDGTSESVEYTSCCQRIVTDGGGVETTYSADPLGRTTSAVRSEVNATGSPHPAQPAITTGYDYVPKQITTTTDVTNGPSQTSTREYDNARRPVSEVAAGLKTLYAYGTATGGGRTVTVYTGYATGATAGTPGTRDQITTYYRDGQVKSVTGAAAVARYYTYGAGSGARWTTVTTGTENGPRYVTTTSDMLGRVQEEERPGWAASGTVTLTTTYHYDTTGADAGLLKRIERSHAAGTLYEYNELGVTTTTAVDADNDGTLDGTGPDRVTTSAVTYEQVSGAWWRIAKTSVRPDGCGEQGAVVVSETWQQVTELASGTVAVTKERDPVTHQFTRITTVTVVPNACLRTETVALIESTAAAERVWYGGRLVQEISGTGWRTLYGYDGLGRPTTVTDGRGNTTTTAYDSNGRVESVTDESGATTAYTYYAAGTDAPGRISSVQIPDTTSSTDRFTYYAYDAHGQVTHVWGHVPQPTLTSYNGYGERTALTTFRDVMLNFAGGTWPSGATTEDGDTTMWSPHEATGLLETKSYADGKEVTYTYLPAGALATRTWARDLTTTYTYNDGQSGRLWTGERVAIDYPSGTPDVAYEYDRLGRLVEVSDATGTRTFAYDPDSLRPTTETLDDYFGERVITQLYEDGAGSYELPGRFAGVQVGTSNDPDEDYAAGYAYDQRGRLQTVTGPGLPAEKAEYEYQSDSSSPPVLSSPRVAHLRFKNGSVTRADTEWTYETSRDLKTAVINRWYNSSGGDERVLSQYDYTNNARAQRTGKDRSGWAFWWAPFGDDFAEVYTYNDRGELTGAGRSDDEAFDRSYSYDPIGNRTLATEGNPALTTEYATNALNQYRWLTSELPEVAPLLAYDDDGNLIRIADMVPADMNCDGVASFDDIDCLAAAFGCDDTYDPPPNYAACLPCDCLLGDFDQDGDVDFDDIALFTAQLPNSGVRKQLDWDAENRLIRVAPPDGRQQAWDLKVEFEYDYRNRRVARRVYTWDGAEWDLTAGRKYVWDGWRLLLELNVSDQTMTVLRAYTWGLDLAGQAGGGNGPGRTTGASLLEGAGTIGGLLAAFDAYGAGTGDDRRLLYTYDGNGNVGQVIDLSQTFGMGTFAASYEYDPYGNIVQWNGTYRFRNPFQFSTKQFDAETGMGYWGERYYGPDIGRWANRDPIEEADGVNLYAYVQSDPVRCFDVLGLSSSGGNTVGVGAAVAAAVAEANAAIAAIRIAGSVTAAYAAYYAALAALEKAETLIGAVAGDLTHRLRALRDSAEQALRAALERLQDSAPPIPDPQPTPEPDPDPEPKPKDPPQKDPTPDPRKCLPCVPPVGTRAFEVHTTHYDNGMKPHTHHFEMHQSPPSMGCECFWKRNYIRTSPGCSPAPGEVAMPGPALGGTIAPTAFSCAAGS